MKVSKKIHPAKQLSFDKVKKAILSFTRSKEKMSINKIAKKASIERKTIYNNPEILQYCKQSIEVQKSTIIALQEPSDSVEKKPSSIELLEQRYMKAKERIKEEQIKNAKLLSNYNESILRNSDLLVRIENLEKFIQQLKEEGKNNIIPIK